MVWLIAIAVVLVAQNAICDLSLDMPHQVKGIRGRSLIIPCTYKPSDQYTVSEVLWYFGNKVFFNRISTEDHVLLADYRNKVSVSKAPGDVSLTLRNLNAFDRGDYKCRVTWKSNVESKKFVTKELISSVIVLKGPIATEKPKVVITTEGPSTSATNNVIPENHDGDIKTTYEPNHSTETFRKQNASSAISTPAFLQTTNHDGKSEHSTITQPITDNSELGAIEQRSGMFPYIIIITGLICILLVVILIIVLTIRRKKKEGYNVGGLTMNQLTERADAASANLNNCQSCASQAPSRMNDYEVQKRGSQNEYQTMTFRNDNEYELLLTEREKNI